MELNLRGRTALITGASRGIGHASAEALASEGVNVILVSRYTVDLEATRTDIVSRCKVNVQVHNYDLSDSRNIDALIAEHPDIDILVNNAGAIPVGSLDEITEDRWREAWDLKVFGNINMCRRFYAAMRTRGRGVIINIMEVAGERMDRTYIAASTGNAALMALTRTLGGSAGGDGLRVVGVNPGTIATNRLLSIMKAKCAPGIVWATKNRWEELDEVAAHGARGQAGGNRRDGRLPRIRCFGLHDRNDHYDRRRFGQSLTFILILVGA